MTNQPANTGEAGVSPALAHTSEDGRHHLLSDHLVGTAERAAMFAEAFSSGKWGHLAGLWHDIGKLQTEFQAKLKGEHCAVEHSGAGAALAVHLFKDPAIPLAFVIAGHHAGLANMVASGDGLPSPLKERLRANRTLVSCLLPGIPAVASSQSLPELPAFLSEATKTDRKSQAVLSRRTEFWIRFLLSALVDADRLDTERFADPATADLRGSPSSIGELRKRIDTYIDEKVNSIPVGAQRSVVNQARSAVLGACRAASQEPTGIFRLTVPTGGGKTLSAMSFALRHAEYHHLGRVIVVIPYTSIIEQNAAEYQRALGMENVIEHHSNVDPAINADEYGADSVRRRELACENWDAPIIVTTSVQFFESLFSSRSSRCRKIHNIARSVIVLDEVQTLPPGLLTSVLEALNELVANYGCSVLLSTATPPALAARQGFEQGLRGIREIVADSMRLEGKLRRVEYSWPSAGGLPSGWHDLATDVANHDQVLVVVHKRADARVLAQTVQTLRPKEPVFHLSALMCPAHRLDVLKQIKKALSDSVVCRVVSTQLVEAGVDIDFPVVYRALGGLDSVVQAAGRCNREGKLEKGRVLVFRAPSTPPRGTPRRAMEITETLLQQNGDTLDPHDPSILEAYFRMLYFAENLDARNIQSHREQFNFATVGMEFRLIEDGFTQALVVPYRDAEACLSQLRREGPNRRNLRALQTYTVNVYPDAFEKLQRAGALEEVTEGVFALVPGFTDLYDAVFGLVVGDEPLANPEAFIW
jgi:CRISPR-associated endonuclease/helicase Cas3